MGGGKSQSEIPSPLKASRATALKIGARHRLAPKMEPLAGWIFISGQHNLRAKEVTA